MKKTVLMIAALLVLAGGAYIGVTAFGADGPAVASTSAVRNGTSTDPNQPDRTAEVKGLVLSVDGTTVVIDRYIQDPSAELSDAEKAAKKAERASLTMEERQALKASESAALETERISITIPVGTPIVQMVLNGDEPVAEPSTLAAVRGGAEITVWTDGGTDGASALYVKLASAK